MAGKDPILGVLVEQPSCAYELAVVVEQRLGPARLSARSVYAALRTLERERLAARVDERSATAVPWSRKKYGVTESGMRHFAEWMDARTEMSPLRDELLVKFSGPNNCARLAAVAYARELYCRAELETAAQEPIATRRPPSGGSLRTWQGDLKAVGRATRAGYWESRSAWLQSVRNTLDAVQARRS